MVGKKRRFIAGAICPKCGELDKIVLDGDAQYCVACNYNADEPPPAHSDDAPKPLKFGQTPDDDNDVV